MPKRLLIYPGVSSALRIPAFHSILALSYPIGLRDPVPRISTFRQNIRVNQVRTSNLIRQEILAQRARGYSGQSQPKPARLRRRSQCLVRL